MENLIFLDLEEIEDPKKRIYNFRQTLAPNFLEKKSYKKELLHLKIKMKISQIKLYNPLPNRIFSEENSAHPNLKKVHNFDSDEDEDGLNIYKFCYKKK